MGFSKEVFFRVINHPYLVLEIFMGFQIMRKPSPTLWLHPTLTLPHGEREEQGREGAQHLMKRAPVLVSVRLGVKPCFCNLPAVLGCLCLHFLILNCKGLARYMCKRFAQHGDNQLIPAITINRLFSKLSSSVDLKSIVLLEHAFSCSSAQRRKEATIY